jgi:hypothetical protein
MLIFPCSSRDLNSDMPIPAEIIVYSLREWEKMKRENTRFFRMLDRDAVWTLSMVGE